MAQTIKQVATAALDELSLLKFFPNDPGSRAALLKLLCRMVAGPAELRWLIQTVLAYHDEWPGPRQLRAIYCTRYRPEDGIEGNLTGGKLASDIEERAIEAHEQEKALPMAPESRKLIADVGREWSQS